MSDEVTDLARSVGLFDPTPAEPEAKILHFPTPPAAELLAEQLWTRLKEMRPPADAEPAFDEGFRAAVSELARELVHLSGRR